MQCPEATSFFRFFRPGLLALGAPECNASRPTLHASHACFFFFCPLLSPFLRAFPPFLPKKSSTYKYEYDYCTVRVSGTCIIHKRPKNLATSTRKPYDYTRHSLTPSCQHADTADGHCESSALSLAVEAIRTRRHAPAPLRAREPPRHSIRENKRKIDGGIKKKKRVGTPLQYCTQGIIPSKVPGKIQCTHCEKSNNPSPAFFFFW